MQGWMHRMLMDEYQEYQVVPEENRHQAVIHIWHYVYGVGYKEGMDWLEDRKQWIEQMVQSPVQIQIYYKGVFILQIEFTLVVELEEVTALVQCLDAYYLRQHLGVEFAGKKEIDYHQKEGCSYAEPC